MTNVQTLTPWAYYAILDCSSIDSAAISSESVVRTVLTELSTLVAESAIGEAYIAITGDDPNNQGFNATQLLNVGFINLKIVNQHHHAYFDIFSCKEFTVSDTETVIKKHFGESAVINKILLPRNAGITVPN